MARDRPKHIPIVVHIPDSAGSSPRSSISSDSSSNTYVSCSSSPPPSPKSTSSTSSTRSARSTESPVASITSHSNVIRTRRPSPPKHALLGAIDENSGAVLPDIPISPDNKNNPVARLHVYSALLATKKKQPHTLATASTPPPDVFGALLGPNGETFADLRLNRRMADVKKGTLKKLMCLW